MASKKGGYYFYPHITEVKTCNAILDEKFCPILHTTKSKNLDKVINKINNCSFGMTFDIHSCVEEQIKYIRSKIRVDNIYANHSIIGKPPGF